MMNHCTEDTPIRGILFLMGGVFIFSTQDVLIKYLSNGYPLFEIMFIRSITAIVPGLILVHFDSGLPSLKTKLAGAHFIRSTLLFLSYTFYYLGLAALPLADAVALFYTAPFFVTILSIIILKDKVGISQWVALMTGFTGVLIMLHPGDGFGIIDKAAILPVLAALSYACAVLVTRRIAPSESASVMGFNLVVYSILVSGGLGLLLGNGLEIVNPNLVLDFITRAWIFPPAKDLGIMMGIGVFVSIGFYCLTQAYRVAKPSTIAPFEYTGMVPAVIWGFFFWNEIPSSTTLMGILFIVVSGIYLVRLGTRHKAVKSWPSPKL
jgi:drug/metabolite transporter (DMT)-like permease